MISPTALGVLLLGAWACTIPLLVRDGRGRLAAIVAVGTVVAGVALAATRADADARVSMLCASLVPVVTAAFVLGLPSGNLARRDRLLLGVEAAVAVLGAAGAAAGGTTSSVLVGGWSVVAVAAALPLSYRTYERASPVDRRRMQWVGLATVLALEAAVVAVALNLLLGRPRQPSTVALVAALGVPLAVAAGATPRIVARVDRLLARAVSAAGLTGLVVAVYVVVVIGLRRPPQDAERDVLLLSMVAAAIVAVAYGPARDRLQEFANRIVYGQRTSPEAALRTFATRMSRAIPLDELLLQLAESLKKSFQVDQVEVWTGTDGVYERTVSLPHRATRTITVAGNERGVVARAGVVGGTWLEVWLPALIDERDTSLVRVAPLAHAGELLGLVVLVRGPNDEPLTDHQDDLLRELARQVGLALHNVQLDSALQASLDEVRRKAEELQDSRLRLVTAADAERRRLERDLHDGAQQQLVALSLKLALLRGLLDGNTGAAALVGELKEDVSSAVEELRNLAHGIFPPLLMSGGLPSALSAAAGRAPVPASVESEGVGRYDQAVESTVYFCCLEAMQNAAKHAGDTASVTVRLWQDDERPSLCFEVRDDGPGFEPTEDAVRGHGFVNMRDRLGAIGGELVVRSQPGTGTTVGGRIPLPSLAPA